MFEDSQQASKRIQGPFALHLRTSATSLMEDSYVDVSVKAKLWCPADLGRWMERKGLTVANVNEHQVEAFVRRHQHLGRGDPKRSSSFAIISENGALFQIERWLPTDRPWLTF